MHPLFTQDSLFSQDHAALVQALEHHNRIWDQRLQNAARYIPAPLWARNTILSPEKNALTDSFLPWEDLSASLRRIGRALFADSGHIPLLLQSCRDFCSLMHRNYSLKSVLEFWQMLPDSLAGRLHYSEDDLLPLFCALADPARFGTAAERYPAQLQHFQELLEQYHPCSSGNAPLQILDLGCGIGLGTLELGSVLQQRTDGYQVTGVTIEPLEVWMAAGRRLPHCPEREAAFRAFPENLHCRFLAGDAESFNDGRHYDFIFCNGLAGGRFLNQDSALKNFLGNIRRLLSPGGVLLAANHFHEGFLPGVKKLMQFAGQMGFQVEGSPDDLLFRQSPVFPEGGQS